MLSLWNLNTKYKPVIFFYISITVICLFFKNEIYFLVNEYWTVIQNLHISKGPVIWLLCLVLIHRSLLKGGLRDSTSTIDIYLTLAIVSLLLVFNRSIAMAAPSILVILTWYLLSATEKKSNFIIVWFLLLISYPFYSEANTLLQGVAVYVTENMLHLVGIPVLVQEFYIAIPDGLFKIEESCSGYRYMRNNILILFAYSFLSRFNLYQFSMAFLLTVAIALLVNWFRVVLIIIYAYNYGIENEFVQDHGDFGWYLYAFFLFPYFYLLLKIDKSRHFAVPQWSLQKRVAYPLPAILLLVPVFVIIGIQKWIY